ncbi:hypothetical protein VTN77DRAFT_1858 [Rasamsonia byssochlamydoides]|uniref:uncharacterized protein n=1 Tax=Rasamsonia byssochlamydoides TaxID=89139 RepID=UPI003742570C
MSPSLLDLPAELRLMIFEFLFLSITVRIGFERNTPSTHTSILSTCRLINNEAAPLLAKNIVLHFGSTAAMLDVLTTLPLPLISQLRRLRVKAFPVPLRLRGVLCPTFYLHEVLPILSNLRLDLLVVEDCYHDPGVNHDIADVATCFEIHGLINTNGWKELHFVSPTTEFIVSRTCYDLCDQHHVRQLQGWDALLKARDGQDSGASVKMYVAKQPGVQGATARPETREEFNVVSLISNLPDGSDTREVLVVAKRGDKADFAVDRSNSRLRRALGKRTWQKVREKGLYINPESDPCSYLL